MSDRGGGRARRSQRAAACPRSSPARWDRRALPASRKYDSCVIHVSRITQYGTGNTEYATMAATLKLEIVTPESKTYSEDVEMVTLPGVEGEMGIFPQHVPLMTQIVSGEITVRKDGRDYFLAVGEGFVEITG